MNTLIGAAIAAALLVSPLAFAGHYNHDRGDYPAYGQSVYGQERYGHSEFAEVVDSRPVYREIRVPVSHEQCYDERVPTRSSARIGETGGTLIGGILGYVAGNQIGKGTGRDVARVAGAVTGAAIGSSYGNRGASGYGDEYTYQTRCRTVRDYRYETALDGYDVTYRYNGRIFQTRWPHDPGARIPVDVDVRPVRY